MSEQTLEKGKKAQMSKSIKSIVYKVIDWAVTLYIAFLLGFFVLLLVSFLFRPF